jgi:hypothetical protein
VLDVLAEGAARATDEDRRSGRRDQFRQASRPPPAPRRRQTPFAGESGHLLLPLTPEIVFSEKRRIVSTTRARPEVAIDGCESRGHLVQAL